VPVYKADEDITKDTSAKFDNLNELADQEERKTNRFVIRLKDNRNEKMRYLLLPSGTTENAAVKMENTAKSIYPSFEVEKFPIFKFPVQWVDGIAKNIS